MKIVIIGYNDVCGLLSNIKMGVNKYTEHEVVLGVKTKEYYFQGTGGIDFRLDDKVSMKEAMTDCDVVHWSDIQPVYNRRYYGIPDIGIDVVHVHGTDCRRNAELYAPLDYPVLYSTPDLCGFLKNGRKMWLPSPLREGLPEMLPDQEVPVHMPYPDTMHDDRRVSGNHTANVRRWFETRLPWEAQASTKAQRYVHGYMPEPGFPVQVIGASPELTLHGGDA